MSKLPIQPLLYLASLGLAAGSGWTFYQTMTQEKPPSAQEIQDQTDKSLAAGRKETPDDRRDDYTPQTLSWWKNFQEVNWIGKVEKPPEPTAKIEEKKPVTPANIKAEEVVAVVCVVFDPKGESRCVVRYLKQDVQPPADLLPKASGAGSGGWAGPGDGARRAGNPGAAAAARAANQRANQRGARGGMPTFGADDGTPEHHLGINDQLWPPYDDFYLARVDEDAQTVYFKRKVNEGKAEDIDVEDTVYKNELQLDSDVLAQVRDEDFSVPVAAPHLQHLLPLQAD